MLRTRLDALLTPQRHLNFIWRLALTGCTFFWILLVVGVNGFSLRKVEVNMLLPAYLRLGALLAFSRKLSCQLALAGSLIFWIGVVVAIITAPELMCLQALR